MSASGGISRDSLPRVASCTVGEAGAEAGKVPGVAVKIAGGGADSSEDDSGEVELKRFGYRARISAMENGCELLSV